MSVVDHCDNDIHESITVETDKTPPEVSITYPQHTDTLGIIVEVLGTATDLNFAGYQLMVEESGQFINGGGNPVEDDVLGTWNTFDVAEGLWTLYLTAEDGAGNIGEASAVVYVGPRDELIKELKTTPRLFSPNGDGQLDSTQIEYEITQICDIRIDIHDDSDQLIKTHAVASVSPEQHSYIWDGTDTGGTIVQDGEYRIILTAALSSDTNIKHTEEITVVVDSTPPLIEIDEPVNHTCLTGGITTSGSITDQNLEGLSISLTGVAGTEVLYEDNQNREDYTFVSLEDQAEGDYSLTVYANDLAANESQETIEVTIDRTPPAIVLDTPIDGENYGGVKDTVLVTGTIEEENFTQYVLRYGTGDDPGSWTDLVSSSTLPLEENLFSWSVGQGAGIPDGLYTISLLATDCANSETEARVKVNIDNTPPVVAITSPGNGDYVTRPVDIEGTASDANLEEYTVAVSEGECELPPGYHRA